MDSYYYYEQHEQLNIMGSYTVDGSGADCKSVVLCDSLGSTPRLPI